VPVEHKKREYQGEPAELEAGAVSAQEQERWRRLAEALKAKVHEYITEAGTRFIDRVEEIERLFGTRSAIMWGGVTVLYGPKGCGKTTFFRALAWAAHELGLHSEGYRVLLAEYVEEKGVVSISGPEGVVERFKGALARAFGRAEVGITASVAGVVPFLTVKVGSRSARSPNPHMPLIIDLVDEIAKDPEEGHYILIVDEYRVSDVERFRRLLETLPNYLYRISEVMRGRLGGKSSSISVVITTSDAVAAKLTGPVGNKVGWLYMWNFPREVSEVYAGQLGLLERVSEELGLGREKAGELLWRLAGGNPRELRIMAKEGITPWLDSTAGKVVDTVNTLEGSLGGRLWGALGEVLERIDIISKHKDLYDTFLSEDIVVRLVGARPISPLPREPWVGRLYAFQFPAYYYALRAIHRKRSTDITPRDILEEALKG